MPFPLIVLAAGFVGGRAGLAAFKTGGGHKAGSGPVLSDADSMLGEDIPAHARPNLAWSLRMSTVLLALWLIPVAAVYAVFGADSVFAEIGLFFSKMAVVTFGGAYAVLAYVAQEAVQHFGWLKPGETTPGPLITVVQFVGFMGAYRNPGSLDPMQAATLAAILTTWVTFVPCFLWIFLGAPFIEKLRQYRAGSGNVGDNGGGGRGHSQPRHLVWPAHTVCRGCRRQLWRPAARYPRAAIGRAGGNGAVCRRRDRDLPVQGFRHRDTAQLRRRRNGLDAGDN